MALQIKTRGRATSVAYGLAVGVLVSFIITVVAAVIIAKLVDKELLQWEHTGYSILISLFMASVMGSITAFFNIKHQRLLVCSLSGVSYWSILIIITTVFFGGAYEGVLPIATVVLTGSLTAFVLTAPRSRQRLGNTHRKRHR